MADDKNGREKQARDSDDRQRERAVAEGLARGDEPEPPLDAERLGDLEAKLETLEFPATGAGIVAAVGDHEVESATKRYTVEELVPGTDDEAFDSPAAVTVQILRPTVAAATKRVVEASKTLPNTELPWSQRKAYETTFLELEAIAPDDDDEGIRVIADWIVEYIREKEQLPGSREVRREAATFCRENGYRVRNDEWLGI